MAVAAASQSDADAVASQAGAKREEISRTQMRRQQRLHSQQSYKSLKVKLLSLVQPLPAAPEATRLEEFRGWLFAPGQQFLPSPEATAVPKPSLTEPMLHECQWCGVLAPVRASRVPENQASGISGHLTSEEKPELQPAEPTPVPEEEPLPFRECSLAEAFVDSPEEAALEEAVLSSSWWSSILQAERPVPVVLEEQPPPTHPQSEVVVYRKSATKQQMLCAEFQQWPSSSRRSLPVFWTAQVEKKANTDGSDELLEKELQRQSLGVFSDQSWFEAHQPESGGTQVGGPGSCVTEAMSALGTLAPQQVPEGVFSDESWFAAMKPFQ